MKIFCEGGSNGGHEIDVGGYSGNQYIQLYKNQWSRVISYAQSVYAVSEDVELYKRTTRTKDGLAVFEYVEK